jgi:hypothetical protein
MEASENTAVQAEDIAPVTDTESAEATKSETTTQTPAVEMRDGKMYIEGVGRVYTRDDTNKIASNAKNEAMNGVLRDLDVDSFDQVKDVITQLKSTPLTEDGQSSLDVRALKQAVAKREATVEELQSEVNKLRTDLLLKDHLGNLQNAMPTGWNPDQKTAVLDLMKARNMFAVEDNSFQLRNGEDFLTVDGEKPDYNSAVELVGKSLGLPFGKKGVDVVNSGENTSEAGSRTAKGLDEARLTSDPEYRAAYTHVRKYSPGVKRQEITNNMVIKQLERARNLRG